jgi:hypothetical protein
MLHGSADIAFCPLDGGAIADNVDPWPGRTTDERYQIESLIGAGGMGRVYRALHLKLDERVAIKLLNGELAADGRTGQRFAREARSTMRIRSPHVVRVHDLGELPPASPSSSWSSSPGSRWRSCSPAGCACRASRWRCSARSSRAASPTRTPRA